MVTRLGRPGTVVLTLCGCSSDGADTSVVDATPVVPAEGVYSPTEMLVSTDCTRSVTDDWLLADFYVGDITASSMRLTASYYNPPDREIGDSFTCERADPWFGGREEGESFSYEVQGVWLAETRLRVMLTYEWLGDDDSPQPCASVQQFTLAPYVGPR